MSINIYRLTRLSFDREKLNLAERSPPASEAGNAVSRQKSWLARRREAMRRSWQGEAPLEQVFWDDMLLAGTGVNVATTLLAMFLFLADAPVALAVTGAGLAD